MVGQPVADAVAVEDVLALHKHCQVDLILLEGGLPRILTDK